MDSRPFTQLVINTGDYLFTKPIDGSSLSNNKPRNLLLLDATGPLTLQFRPYGTLITLTFDQLCFAEN